MMQLSDHSVHIVAGPGKPYSLTGSRVLGLGVWSVSVAASLRGALCRELPSAGTPSLQASCDDPRVALPHHGPVERCPLVAY